MNIGQFVFEGIRIAVKAISSYRMRSFLTMLGVAIGIFVITSILTMVDSMQSSVTANLSKLGNTTMFVHNWPWSFGGDDWYKYINRPRVSYKDYQKVKNNLEGVEGVSLEASVSGRVVKYEGRSIDNVRLVGATEDLRILAGFDLAEGRFISELEFRRGAAVCLMGHEIAKGLFEGQPAAGKYIRLGGKRLLVAGVISKQGMGLGPTVDLTLYVPYQTAAGMYPLHRRWVDKVLVVKANDYEEMDYVQSELIGLIRASRSLKPAVEDNFSINKQEMLMDQMNSVFGGLELGGWVVSLFSLLIGAFSIGNIMYISVKERTREIGIQKSLGATRSFILYQFITEAVIICILGGAIGIVLVFGLAEGVQILIRSMELPLNIAVSGYALLMGSFLCISTGLLAGIIPASIAARLDPVVAIRST